MPAELGVAARASPAYEVASALDEPLGEQPQASSPRAPQAHDERMLHLTVGEYRFTIEL